MISPDDVKNIIDEFSEKNNFIQQQYIENIESSDFNVNIYNLINGKNFVSYKGEDVRNIIEFGTISIEVDRSDIDFEDYYGIYKNITFIIRLDETITKEILPSLILEKCIFNNLICIDYSQQGLVV